MRIDRLTIEQVRVFDRVVLEPASGLNLMLGDNGAGKTSVLEAICLLANGRSFRGGIKDALIRQGQTELRVFAELVQEQSGRSLRLGLSRSPKSWVGRIDGQDVDVLSQLFQSLAVICFEPGSHALISGPSELRRRFVDWALFHVEPSFLGLWRRYQRALKQRNALLKQQAGAAELDVWEEEMAVHGAVLHQYRQIWLGQFEPRLAELSQVFLGELGPPTLRHQAGWAGETDADGLRAALQANRNRDLILGHSSIGPHRSDWVPGFEHAPLREMLSRGQEKLAALACLMAQAICFAAARNEWPVLLLDDLPSELDAGHLARTLDWLGQRPAQVFITGTTRLELPASVARLNAVFHVEHGRMGRLL